MAQEDDENKDPALDAEQEGAEGGVAEGGEEVAAAGAKKKKMMMLVLAGVTLLILLVGGGAAFLFLSGGEHAEGEAGKASSEGLKTKPAYYPLGDMIVNLSGEGKRPNYLKVKVTLELADEKDASLMDLIKPRIIDNFQVYLRELRIEDLRGSAGMYRLREELLMRVSEAAQPVRIRDVLFQEMLVQ